MFRYFVYGSMAVVTAMGALFYVSFTTQGWLGNAAGDWSERLRLRVTIVSAYLGYAALAAAQTPLGVVFQRYILLREPPRHSYFAYWASSYGRRFFWASAAVYGYFLVASLIHVPFFLLFYGTDPFDQVAVSTLFATTPSALTVFIAIYASALLCACLLAARSSLAFPMAAADRPGSALRQSFAESRGTMWRLFLVFVLIYAPAFVAYFIVFMIVMRHHRDPEPGHGGRGRSIRSELQNPGLFTSPSFIIAVIIALIAFALSQVAIVAAARARPIRSASSAACRELQRFSREEFSKRPENAVRDSAAIVRDGGYRTGPALAAVAIPFPLPLPFPCRSVPIAVTVPIAIGVAIPFALAFAIGSPIGIAIRAIRCCSWHCSRCCWRRGLLHRRSSRLRRRHDPVPTLKPRHCCRPLHPRRCLCRGRR